jgi:20S proteasome subunit beta 7
LQLTTLVCNRGIRSTLLITTASYGSLARFTDVKRLRKFNDKTVLGFGGDVSDMQFIERCLIDLSIDEQYREAADANQNDDETSISSDGLAAENVHKYMAKFMYQRRSKFDPLWNHILVGGMDSSDKPFLAFVDLLGTTYSAPSLATGYGAHLAQPVMRLKVPDEESAAKLTEEDAVETIRQCMKVLFYRDARSLDKYSLAIITKSGVKMMENEQLENQSWQFAERIRGYGTQVN